MTPEISVVIGFRDWGADRVYRSARSIVESFGDAVGEVIISDYGSADPEPARRVAEELGARYVYTPGDPVWSRSRALNAGFAVSSGRLLVSTDADMLFSPGAMQRILETADEAEQCALFLQCRDLPPTMGDDYFAGRDSIDWDTLEKVGRLRPRWGMGGMMAIDRAGFEIIRGFDERLHTYGGEDLDFAQRARRAGFRTVWVDDPDVRMYHMYHAPTRRAVEQSEAGRTAVAFNRNVVYHETSYARNTLNWQHKPSTAPPLISVQFATRNRPEYLREAITSVLFQSVQDFEIIVVDDGSDDDRTRDVVEAFGDPRITYVWEEQAGISRARNRALDMSRGIFTAIMDDDDVIHPQRFAWQLEAITAEYAGSAGSFVNFDDETGELELIVSAVPSIANAAEAGGAPGHGTWMLRTDVMRIIRYDESITSGVDNNFFLRLLRAGYEVAHCGHPILLRRRHATQVTAVDSSNQSDSAKQAHQFFGFGFTNWGRSKLAEESKARRYPKTASREEMIAAIEPFLPDHLVRRSATVTLREPLAPIPSFSGTAYRTSVLRDGEPLTSTLRVDNATYDDLASLARLGSDLAAEVMPTDSLDDNDAGRQPAEAAVDDIDWLEEILADYWLSTSPGETVAVERADPRLDRSPDAVRYSILTAQSSEVLHIDLTHVSNRAADESSPWVLIGTSAKEFWS